MACSPINTLLRQQQVLKQVNEDLTKSFGYYIRQKHWQLNMLSNKYDNLKPNLHNYQNRLNSLSDNLLVQFNRYIQLKQAKLTQHSSLLHVMNPYNILQRGYSIIENSDGVIMKSVTKVKHHSKINITFADGKVSAVVDKKLSTEQVELL